MVEFLLSLIERRHTMHSPTVEGWSTSDMSSKQNKSRKRARGRNSHPKAKPPRQMVSTGRSTVAQPVQLDTLRSLPKLGIHSTSTLMTEHGSGIRVRGCADVASFQLSYDSFLGMDWAAIRAAPVGTTLNFVYLNPLVMKRTTNPSRLYFLAQAYTRFRYNRLRVHYTPAVGTGTTDIFALNYFEDPAYGKITFGSGTFSDFSDTDGEVMVSQPWLGASADFSKKVDKSWKYIDLDDDTDAGTRLSYSGLIGAAWGLSQSPTEINLTTGFLWIEYEIDLAQPYQYQDLALDSKESKGLTAPRTRRLQIPAAPPSRVDIKQQPLPPDKAPFPSSAQAEGDSPACDAGPGSQSRPEPARSGDVEVAVSALLKTLRLKG